MVEVKEQSAYLMVYTRKVLADSYPDGLARSVHMAVSHDGVCYTAQNKNYAILFAEAEILPDNTLAPRGVKEPWMFEAEEGYGIAAVRVQENGTQEYESGADVLFWYTEDLISFEQKACVHLVADTPVEVVQCTWKEEKKRYELFWKDQEEKWYQAEVENLWKNQTVCGKQSFCEKKPFRWFQKPEGAEAGNILEIRSDVCARAESRWKPVVHTKTLVPDKVKVGHVEDLNSVQAQAVYSDGSVCAKKIKWDLPDTEKQSIGKVAIGVVEGDTHDIGKNLVRIMLETGGFDVYDLGRDVALDTFVDYVRDNDVDILCMSSLMTTTMPGMGKVIEKLKKADLRDKVKIMVGGAPVSPAFAEKIGADGYTRNAIEAVEFAKKLVGAA